jgi:hypothetical protein
MGEVRKMGIKLTEKDYSRVERIERSKKVQNQKKKGNTMFKAKKQRIREEELIGEYGQFLDIRI